MSHQITAEAFDALRRQVQGDVLLAGDDGYEQARTVWNGMVDRRPALVVRAAGTPDVVAAVDVARRQGLPLAVKAGGHNVAGKAVCDDGVLVDLSRMRAVRVDRATRTAFVQGGATLHDLDAQTQQHGLATTGGVDSRTGVAGLTLGGGNGYLARSLGLAVDNLVGADVVTASGDVVHAGEHENADLFWALRGGGGNFGVVTSFEFRLHPVGPDVLTVQAFHPYDAAEEVLRWYRDAMAKAPDGLGLYAMLVNVPPVAPFPPEAHGRPAIALAGMFAGDRETAHEHLLPVAEMGDPLMAGLAPMPYVALQQSTDQGTPDGARYYYKSQFLRALSDEGIATLVERAAPLPGPFTMIGVEPMGGAIARVPRDATAFAHRDAAFNLGVWPGWTDEEDDAGIIAWARDVHAAMTPHGTGGAYVNYLDADEPDAVGTAYGELAGRLATVKLRWDPENLFRVNHNIAPRRDTSGA